MDVIIIKLMAQCNGSNGSSDYESRQAVMDKRYKEAYAEWVNSLDEAQYAEVERAYVSHAELSYCTHAMEPFQFRQQAVRIPPEPEPTMSHDAAEAVMKLVLYLADSVNPRLELHVLSFLFGFQLQIGVTETALAARHGITRQAFSKRVREMKKRFNVKGCSLMRSDAVCANYRLTNGASRQSP